MKSKIGRPDIKNPGIVKKVNSITGFVRISALDCTYENGHVKVKSNVKKIVYLLK
jgi:hypothetical protein